jgi:hypothetical protein
VEDRQTGDTLPVVAMRRAFAVLFVVLGYVSLDGCKSSSCSLAASDYDQACQEDSDCVAVFLGSFCASHSCACENAAINVSSYNQYSSDFDRDDAPRCPCPDAPPVACNQGTCGLRGSGVAEAGSD